MDLTILEQDIASLTGIALPGLSAIETQHLRKAVKEGEIKTKAQEGAFEKYVELKSKEAVSAPKTLEQVGQSTTTEDVEDVENVGDVENKVLKVKKDDLLEKIENASPHWKVVMEPLIPKIKAIKIEPSPVSLLDKAITDLFQKTIFENEKITEESLSQVVNDDTALTSLRQVCAHLLGLVDQFIPIECLEKEEDNALLFCFIESSKIEIWED